MLDNLKKSDDIQQDQDRLGGSKVFESGLVDFEIEHAFFTKSKGGALALNVRHVDDKGTRHDEQFWVTSGDSKGNKNYYEKDGAKFYLPGFLTADSLALLAAKKPLSDLTVEDKVLKLYDFDAKKELPTNVKAVVDLFGKKITAGVLKEVVDKNKDTGQKNADGSKIYAPTGESREQNVVDKYFRATDGFTVPEIVGGATASEFKKQWADRNTGAVRDKRSNKSGAPTPSGSAGSSQQQKPAKSLFDDE